MRIEVGSKHILRKIVPHRFLKFDLADTRLLRTVDFFTDHTRKIIADSPQLELHEAVRQSIVDSFGRDSDRLNISAFLPHRLIDRFSGRDEKPPSCLDFAFMFHLVMEKMGLTGSEVVAIIEGIKKLSFAITYNKQIVVGDKPSKWMSFKEFEEKRLAKGHYDRLVNIFP